MSHELHYYPHLREPITLVGCGGVGSVVAAVLAKTGTPRITLYDDDIVEPVNLQMQHFPVSALGAYKAHAVQAELLRLRPDMELRAHIARANAQTAFDGIVVMGVDLQESRRQVLQACIYSKVPLLIDGRLRRAAPDYCEVYAIDPSNGQVVKDYLDWCEDADPSIQHESRPKGFAAHTPAILSGAIGWLLARWCEGRSLPWRTTIDLAAPHMEPYYAPLMECNDG